MNKTDQFEDFDPTQIQNGGCCSETYYNYETQTWKVRAVNPNQNSDNSQLQAELDQANATIADLNRLLEQKNQELAALQLQLDNQPTVCDILKQHLDPIHRLNGDLIGYGIKNPPECLTDGEVVTGLNADNELTTVITP